MTVDGVTLSLISAILFGASAVSARVALRGADLRFGAMLGNLIGLPLLVIVAYSEGEFSSLGGLTLIPVTALALAGLANFFAGRLFTYRAIELVGSNRTYALITTFPLYAALLAVAFLGESLTVNSGLAIALIVLGGVALTRSNVADPSASPSGGTRFFKGMRYAASAAVMFGISNFLTRAAVRASSFPVVGAAISFTAALTGYFVLLSMFPIPLSPSDSKAESRLRRFWWFFIDGMFRAGALICSYSALQSTSVVIVSPIVAAQSLFAILFSYLVIRRFEVFHAAVIVGAILVLSGIVILYAPPI